MRARTWTEIGGNRGATRVGEALVASASGVTRVDVIDPKPGRAERLRGLYEKNGIPGRAFEGRGEILADDSDADGVVVAVDDLLAMHALVGSQKHRPVIAQAVFQAPRGPGRPGTVYGFSVGVAPGRDDQRKGGTELLRALEGVSVRASSAAMRQDSVNAFGLHTHRQKVSERTVEHMRDFKPIEDAEHVGELFAFREQFPLVVHRSAEPDLHRRLEEAKEIGASRRGRTALALPHEGGVDLAVMERVRGGRVVTRDYVCVPRPGRTPLLPRLHGTPGLVVSLVGMLLSPLLLTD